MGLLPGQDHDGDLSSIADLLPPETELPDAGPRITPRPPAEDDGARAKKKLKIIAAIGGGAALLVVSLCTGAVLLVPRMLDEMLNDKPAIAETFTLSPAVLSWTKHESREFGYSVMLPGTPTSTVLPVKTSPAVSAAMARFSTVDLGSRSFVVGVSPILAADGDTPDGSAAIEAGIHDVETRFQTSVTQRRPVMVSGREGVDFSLKVKREDTELVVNERLFAADQRIYHLIYAALLEAASEEEAEEFFGSFRFIE